MRATGSDGDHYTVKRYSAYIISSLITHPSTHSPISHPKHHQHFGSLARRKPTNGEDPPSTFEKTRSSTAAAFKSTHPRATGHFPGSKYLNLSGKCSSVLRECLASGVRWSWRFDSGHTRLKARREGCSLARSDLSKRRFFCYDRPGEGRRIGATSTGHRDRVVGLGWGGRWITRWVLVSSV